MDSSLDLSLHHFQRAWKHLWKYVQKKNIHALAIMLMGATLIFSVFYTTYRVNTQSVVSGTQAAEK